METFVRAAEVPMPRRFTLPARYYATPEIFAAERERIFLERWVCIGRATELARPGDYLVREVGGESIIILRDRSDAVRAFYNVCRHRGTRLCESPCGSFRETIQCPYHSWSYALDGRLVGAPHMTGREDFDKRDWPLHSVAVAEWEGFLFVNLSREPEPFAEALAPLIGRFTRFNLPLLVPARRIEYEVAANWKLLHENYSECYHCSPVHPQLVKLSPANSGENDLFDGPVLGGFMTITEPGGSMSLSGRACGIPVGPVRDEERQRVYYYSVFPNMLLSLHPDYAMVHVLWPRDHAHTRIVCEWLFHPDAIAAPVFDASDAVEFWDITNRQDWHMCELSQLGVSSRAYVPGPFSPRESLLAAFDRQVLAALGEE